jgi:hypothetical protein
MLTSKRWIYIGFIIVLVALVGACNLPFGVQPQPNDPGLIYTAAAQTIAAQLTQAAAAGQVTSQPPTATTIPTQPLPTNTPLPPTATLPPTNTLPPPTATTPPIPCDRASFVKDVTIPDGSEFSPGEEFVKTWRLRNNGSCTWNSSYSLVFFDKNSMSGPASAQLTTGTVTPGETIDVSVKLAAPTTPGSYEGDWKLRNGSSVIFGIGENAQNHFWVKITVVNNVTFDFIAKADDAEWRNGSKEIDYGDKNNDSEGVAVVGKNVKLEDGKTYATVLGTYPERIDDGMISGKFPEYRVRRGDIFKAQIGLRSSCEDGKVKMHLKYQEGSTVTLLKEWSETCNGQTKSVSFDLADLRGKTVQFILVVTTDGSPRGDKAIWVTPRIERESD